MISFGVVSPEFYSDTNDDYFRFLGREIYRVTPEDSISIHVVNVMGERPYDFFQVHGFKALEPMYTSLWEKEAKV